MGDAIELFGGDRFRVVAVEQNLPGGGTVVRQAVIHPGAVTIVPLIEGSQVVLIRNFRAAVGAELIELPAGTLEPGEPPLRTAQRELTEETGYRAGSWRELPGFWMSPGILRERMHVFVARDLTAGPARREIGEQIENLVVPWEEALAMCDRGEIADAKTIAALLACDRLWRREQGQIV